MKTVILIAMLLIWSGFILWTIKKLWRWSWRSSDDPTENLFWAEVKLGGLFITLGSSLLIAETGQLPPFSYWQQVGLFSFLLFPGALWSMNIGLRLFHYIVD